LLEVSKTLSREPKKNGIEKNTKAKKLQRKRKKTSNEQLLLALHAPLVTEFA